MDEASKSDPLEHDKLRLPKASRSQISVSGKTISIKHEENEVELSVHQALLGSLKEAVSNGIQLLGVGFVTTKTHKRIFNSKVQDVKAWLSERVGDLVIGSDPEFGLIEPNTGSFIYAMNYYGDKKEDNIGTDGPCMELRPKQESSVEKHVENIAGLLKKAYSDNLLKPKVWFSGATYKGPGNARRYTIGGHIHVGTPKEISQHDKIVEYPEILENAYRRIIRVLDEVVGLPMTKIDGPDAGFRRTNRSHGGPYGHFGDFRAQPGRFEWRTPSAIWITHPNFAISILGTVKAVSEECYHRMLDRRFVKDWVYGGVERKKPSFLQDIGCAPDDKVKEILHASTYNSLSKENLEQLHCKLRELGTYRKYEKYLEDFIRITSASEQEAKTIRFDEFRNSWL